MKSVTGDSQCIYGMGGTTSHRNSTSNMSAPTMEAIRVRGRRNGDRGERV